MLAHKANHEGRHAVEVILGHATTFDKRAIPAVVFTDPEIAWAGLTVEEPNEMESHIKWLPTPGRPAVALRHSAARKG